MLLTMYCLSAQSSVVPTGGTASGNGGTVTYTVGQIAAQNNSDGTTSISEGVQQPYEIQTIGIDTTQASRSTLWSIRTRHLAMYS